MLITNYFFSSTIAEVASYGVLQPCKTFVGRKAELSELQKHFTEKACVVVFAMGGQGKTQLCRTFVQSFLKENSSRLVTWFNGNTASDLITSIADFADKQDLPTTNASGKLLPINEILDGIELKLKPTLAKNQGSWLVVIDNVNKKYSDFEEIVEQLISIQSLVLITTRRASIYAGHAAPLELQQLTLDDAKQLVSDQIKNSMEEDVELLCSTLGNHALALQAAVSFIGARKVLSSKGKGYGISDYINEFNRDKEKLFDHKLKLFNYKETMYIVVHKTLVLIKETDNTVGPRAHQIMDVLCLVRPDGIENQYLSTLVDKYAQKLPPKPDISQVKLKKGLRLLREFSLVYLEDDSTSIHPMVQKIARMDSNYIAGLILLSIIEIELTTAPELRHVISIFKNMTTKYPDIIHKTENLDLSRKIYSTMIWLQMSSEILPFAKYNNTLYSNVEATTASLFAENLIANAMNYNGNVSEALERYRRILETSIQTGGVDDRFINYVKSRMQLIKLEDTILDGNLNELVRSEAQIQDILETVFSACFAADSCDFIKLLSILLRGKSAEYQLSTLIKLIKITKADNKNPVLLERELNALLEELITESVTDVKTVVELFQTFGGNETGDTTDARLRYLGNQILSSLMNVEALVEGRTSEALTSIESQYALLLEQFGENSRLTINAKSNMADVLWDLGRKNEALAMKKEAVAVMKTIRGARHRLTLMGLKIVSEWEEELKADCVG